MEFKVNRRILYPVLDTLVERWKKKQFPFTKKDAIIPQTLIPEELRKDKRALACFYFFLCIYMRGGIESAQAFRAMIKLWRDDPHLFDPYHAQMIAPESIQLILRRYVGWDSRIAALNWVANARVLMRHWDGDPLNLLEGLRSWDEAVRRIRNKITKRDRTVAGKDGEGFRGFQYKMVSMLIYFYDWEGWLEKRFLYPSPADFHNFRIGLNQQAITVVPRPEFIRTTEKMSKPWRDAIVAYMKRRKADPIEVSDAIWMFSLVMCGNSPLMAVRELAKERGHKDQPRITAVSELPRGYSLEARRFRKALINTCLRCPIANRCIYAIPSKPYYRKGQLFLRDRPRVERKLGRLPPDIGTREIRREEHKIQQLEFPSALRKLR